MIRQQINLYQERFHPKRLWLSANQLAVAAVVMLVVAAAWSGFLAYRHDAAVEHKLAIETDRARLSAELAAANAELARLLGDNRIDVEIEMTARQISARKKILNFVNDNRFGSGQGFSRYLVALSRLHVDDIWLSRIKFGQDFVHIRGSALDAERVPAYFERFGEESVFVGNRFDLFRVSRDAEHEWKVDFEIATRGPAND